MKHARSILFGIGSALLTTTLAALPANAGGPKTFVSIFGTDGNDCLTGPTACRTLQRAVDQTNSGGEVVIDSAGDFFSVDINKPITLNAPHHGQVDQPADGGPAGANIFFHPPTDADTLFIRGLYMNLLEQNKHGIQINRGSLNLQDAQIQNVGGTNRSGVLFQPDGPGHLVITNTTISNSPFGLTIAGRGDSDVVALVDGAIFVADGTSIKSSPLTGTTNQIVVQNSTLVANGIGVLSSSDRSNVMIKNSTIVGNTTGLSHPGGGVIVSLTGNTVTGNTINGSFTGTIDTK